VDEGLILLLVGAVLAASIVLAFGASRTGVPLLVAFLALGMLLGSDGPGGIEFDDAELARQVGVVCLAAILFEWLSDVLATLAGGGRARGVA
jgi:cell volume regulation protein A